MRAPIKSHGIVGGGTCTGAGALNVNDAEPLLVPSELRLLASITVALATRGLCIQTINLREGYNSVAGIPSKLHEGARLTSEHS